MRFSKIVVVPVRLGLLAGLGLTTAGWPDSVTLTPVADTTLVEGSPDNNLGGQDFFLSGSNSSTNRNRGLLRFDVASPVPAGSAITDAHLVLEVVKTPPTGGASSTFALYRVVQPWGEGNKTGDPLAPRSGAPATTNEATWNSRFALTTNTWGTPGAAAPADFSPLASAAQQIYGTTDSPYTFGSTPALVADVQAWLDDPGTNFGWILISESETTPQTGRRFGSREDPVNSPRLVVDFQPPRIDQVRLDGANCLLGFTARAGRAYALEWRDSLAPLGIWDTLTNIPPPPTETKLVIGDSLLSGARFYRLRLP